MRCKSCCQRRAVHPTATHRAARSTGAVFTRAQVWTGQLPLPSGEVQPWGQVRAIGWSRGEYLPSGTCCATKTLPATTKAGDFQDRGTTPGRYKS